MRPHALHRLTIKHMQALVALDRASSLSKAADALGISQPAFSSRMQEVERLSRTACFHRTGNRLAFTQSGLILLNAARLVLDELNRAEGYLEQLDASPVQIIRLETRGYLLEDHIAPVLAGFMAENPGVVVETSCNAQGFPFENLLGGKVDISIVLGEFARSGVDRQFLRRDDLVGVVPAGHRLASKAHLSAEDFRDDILLVFSGVLERGQEVENLFEPAGILPYRVLSTGNARFVCAMVANNAGLGILGHWAIGKALQGYGLTAVPLTEAGLQANWYAATSKSRTDDQATAALLELLSRAFQ